MNTTYIVLHDGLITAVYSSKNDLIATFRLLLEQHANNARHLHKYSAYELTEHVPDCGVFLTPKHLNIDLLLKEPAHEE